MPNLRDVGRYAFGQYRVLTLLSHSNSTRELFFGVISSFDTVACTTDFFLLASLEFTLRPCSLKTYLILGFRCKREQICVCSGSGERLG